VFPCTRRPAASGCRIIVQADGRYRQANGHGARCKAQSGDLEGRLPSERDSRVIASAHAESSTLDRIAILVLSTINAFTVTLLIHGENNEYHDRQAE